MRTLRTPLGVAVALLVAAVPALAQEFEHREGVIAEPADEPPQRPLVLDRATLERDHPTIARALDQPGTFTPARDDAEEASLRSFWERMADHDGLRVDDVDWHISPAMPQGNLPPGDGAAADTQAEGDAPGLGALAAVVGAGLAALVATRRR